MQAPNIETCFSPALLPLYDLRGRIVVIIDVFRATSTIAAAVDNGARAVIPVDDVAACIALGQQVPGAITAGERDGQIAPGLQHGNSPLEYPREFIEDKTLILTTTNGTRLLHRCHEAAEIITGSFLNLGAVSEYLLEQNQPVLLACASWKDRFNLEDALFAGAVYGIVGGSFQMNCDSTRAATRLYGQAKDDLYGFIQDSSHFLRLSKFGLEYDMEYCCQVDEHNVLVKFQEGRLIKA